MRERVEDTNVNQEKRGIKTYKAPSMQMVKDATEILKQSENDLDIVPVSTVEQIQEVAALAELIWHEHYEPIIGVDQVNYMIEKFQSAPAMKKQMEQEGYQYYMLLHQGKLTGYFAIKEEEETLFLSKFYIDKSYRGRDYARSALNFIEEYCYERRLNKLWLTVNRHNEISIKIYNKLGFKNVGTQVTDIGSGYVMDDFIMEKYFSYDNI